jgi:hypothetical protein
MEVWNKDLKNRNKPICIILYICIYKSKYKMKTTIDLPDELIEKAMIATSSKTKIEAIKKALINIIELEERKKLINFRGKVNLDIDLDILRDRKSLV